MRLRSKKQTQARMREYWSTAGKPEKEKSKTINTARLKSLKLSKKDNRG